MDPEKAAFLFPGADPADALDDPAVTAELLDLDSLGGDDEDEVRLALRRIALQQVLDDDPPQAWAAATRLLADGSSRDEVLDQLATAMLPLVSDALRSDDAAGRGTPLEDHLAMLERLPLPTPEQIEDTMLGIVRARQPVPADTLAEVVAERLGVRPDDEILIALIERTMDGLTEDGGPLHMLARDRVVHVESFITGVPLTHRLSASERATGVLGIDVDLAVFAACTAPRLSDGSELRRVDTPDGGLGWSGPEGWLDGVGADRMLAVRTEPGGLVSIEPVDPPAPSEELAALVRRAYDDAMAETFLPVDAHELLLAVVDRDRAAFAEPRPPLVELTETAGLERRGTDFAHDQEVWDTDAAARRQFRIHHRLGSGPEAHAAWTASETLAGGSPGQAELRDALEAMSDPDVLDAVVDELVGVDGDPARAEALARRALGAASRPVQQAVARYLAALVAESAGRVIDADEHLRAAVRAAPDWDPGAERLAWYRSDRGDAAGALELLRRFEATELGRVLEPLAVPEGPALGRNERCWCGSGRKYKACHLGRPATPPLPDRVDWLYQKAVSFLDHRGTVAGEDRARYADEVGWDDDDPLVLDALLVEGGWFERFITERGPLLPDDEALLARSWTLVSRTVYEVLEIGDVLRVRDLRTGDRIEVRADVLTGLVHERQMVSGRAVPDGEGHRFVGDVRGVPPGTESRMLEVLDECDGPALLRHVAARFRPPQLGVAGDEDEPILDCRAVLEVVDPVRARAELDGRYRPHGDDVWLSTTEVAGDHRILGTLTLSGAQLGVETLTGPRLDTILDELRAALPDARLASDRRRALRPDRAPAAAPATTQLPAEAVEELQDRFERRWCDEAVPALGGRTPREAADDPTRRDDVVRLIRSFGEVDQASGAFGMRPHRLLALLGLDDR